MKRYLSFLGILVLLFSFQELQSQSLRQRVMQKLSGEKAEIKKDSTTVVEIDDVSQSSSARLSNQVMMDALGLTGNVDYETSYSFDAYIQMEISNYKNNGNLDDQVFKKNL